MGATDKCVRWLGLPWLVQACFELAVTTGPARRAVDARRHWTNAVLDSVSNACAGAATMHVLCGGWLHVASGVVCGAVLTALPWRAFAMLQPVVDILLTWGCSPFEVDNWGDTPLHLIMFSPSPLSCRMAELLESTASTLGASVEVNCVDARGCTPLHYAAATGDVAAMQWLIDRGASPAAADLEGYTPEAYALQAGTVIVPPASRAHLSSCARDVFALAPPSRSRVQVWMLRYSYCKQR